jgi:septal ring-binding cell division protein DamX
MEQVRHARIPVHLNAVLIGEKTVPKGCKVRNVSKQGLLLQCDADGRILTFRAGDHVDIHLLFHRPDGTKYHTVAANVRHVDANGIGVEFCQPDAELVKLIESYRVNDTQRLEATITHRRKTGAPERSSSVVAMPAPASSAHAYRQEPADDKSGKRLSYIGLLSLAIAVIIFTAGYLRTFDLASRVSQLEALVNAHDDALATVQPRSSVSANASRVAVAGNKLPSPVVAAHQQSHETAPEREIGTAATAAEGNTQPSEAVSGVSPGTETPETTSTAAPVRRTSEASGKPDTLDSGAWVINLMSSPNKSDADRFAENARKLGVQVEQSSASVNGREFFRVQLTGFATEKDARANAGPVQERLGLKDAWIFKP